MSVAPMYEPPPGISPAEAGTLLDDRIHPRDITSTIVDLAVRGFIKIEETDDKGLLFHHKDYIFHLLQKRQDWRGLAPHERVMLENIFVGDVPDTRLSSLKNRFYTAIPVVRTDIMSALKQKGIYTLDPESANGYSIGAAVGILIPFAILAIPGLGRFLQFRSRARRVRADLCRDLVALCPRDDGEDPERRAHSHRRPGISGIHEPRRRRPPQSHAARPPSKNFFPTRWLSAWNTTGRRPSPAS